MLKTRRAAALCWHYAPCPYTSRRYRRCKCPIWVQGSLGCEWIKKSLNVTSWEAASTLVTAWTASGQIGVVRPDVPPLKEAVEKFLADAAAQQLNWETLRKYQTFLERRLLPWCESKGYRLLKQITPAALVDFRRTWQDGALYATKNIERLRSFFRFCQRMKWTSENPALALKAPKVTSKPTLPFTDAEMKKLLAACDKYRGDKSRIKAFILVMRYSGLRIGDAIALKRNQLTGNNLFLYTQKTGQPVRSAPGLRGPGAEEGRQRGGLFLLDRQEHSISSSQLVALPGERLRTCQGEERAQPSIPRHVRHGIAAGRRAPRGCVHPAWSFQYSDHGEALLALGQGAPAEARGPRQTGMAFGRVRRGDLNC